jgi:ER degradation enhancer, mannosidase alpha-like 2
MSRRAAAPRTVPMVAVLALLAGAACGVLRNPGAPSIDRKAAAERVRTEFLHAWNGYKQGAWGHDDLNPVSNTARDWYDHAPIYMTPVDSLDTMIIMGFDDEANRTRAFLDDTLDFDRDISVKNFEITIRILGGLLSAHQLTNDPRLLAKAEDLGNRLLPVFDSPTGMPYVNVNLKTGAVSDPQSNPAEAGTLILEFGALSKLTRKPIYFDKAKRALVAIYERRSPTTGLVADGIDVETGAWTSTNSHIGGAIDSYYEYLLKCDRLFGDKDCARMWRASLPAIEKYLEDDRPGGLWYGEADMMTGARTATTFGSLQAFFPAVLALAGEMKRARRLQDSSFAMWTQHGIEPEAIDYTTMQVLSAGYQLRPEMVESAYYLYRYTKDPKYLRMGLVVLDDLVKYCRTEHGYTTLRSVVTHEQGDRMHSFFLAETLKYLYLLFKPDAIDFSHVVFNTEAHPLRKTW